MPTLLYSYTHSFSNVGHIRRTISPRSGTRHQPQRTAVCFAVGFSSAFVPKHGDSGCADIRFGISDLSCGRSVSGFRRQRDLIRTCGVIGRFLRPDCCFNTRVVRSNNRSLDSSSGILIWLFKEQAKRRRGKPVQLFLCILYDLRSLHHSQSCAADNCR